MGEKSKGGAPKGNQNAAGHGPPRGNQNAFKHGVYAKLSIADMSEDERRLYDTLIEVSAGNEELAELRYKYARLKKMEPNKKKYLLARRLKNMIKRVILNECYMDTADGKRNITRSEIAKIINELL